MPLLERETWIPRPRNEVFEFFAKAENLGVITPPWMHFQILNEQPITMRPGAIIEYRIRVHALPLRWRTVIETWDPPRRFVDVQQKGPYKIWRHTHTFFDEGDRTRMTDRVEYELPLGLLGSLVNAVWVRRDVAQIFDYRNRKIDEIFSTRP